MSPTLFNQKWIPEPYSGCWIWTGSYAGDGRNEYGVTPARERAHRVSWLIHRGPIPKGLCVCHKCDTPLCVNPDHLFLGTHGDNARDRARKGRNRDQNGVLHSMAKLSDQDILAIRSDRRTRKVIAGQYRIHPVHVWRIKTKRRWRHL
jgi:hypothetical protein